MEKEVKRYHIGGIEVEFPYQPYGAQLAFMGRVIATLNRAVKDGHCHALLESPTGTGKSLALLCSVLGWQQHFNTNSSNFHSGHDSYLAHGGGFLSETECPTPRSDSNNRAQKNKIGRAIYYSSRTHSQISQVIREYRKTAYRVPMAILASRKHYCTNANVNRKENMEEECKLLLKNQEHGCLQYKNLHKVKNHPSIQKGGCNEVHDIEDLVKVGKIMKGCSYFASRSMAEDANIIFCPYNYILNPVIRRAMNVDVKGAIVILDEAHNIEDIARDAGSIDLEDFMLEKLQAELEPLCAIDPMIYQPLYEMTEGLISWIEQKKGVLGKRESQHYFSSWTGDRALTELQEANISQHNFPILLECATKVIKAATDTESEVAHLSGISVTILEGLMSALTYFFSRNGYHVSDYHVVLQRYIKKDKDKTSGEWTVTLSLWCMNPAVVFRDIADLSLSVILTSGTLSPMKSFSSELGVQFGTCLDGPHVVNLHSQVLVSVVSTGFDKYPLNASYKTADSYEFQDSLGKSLEELCTVVPAGSLVFFPSYKFLEKLYNRWSATGQWSRIDALKPIFVEPRGGSQEDLETILKDYYNSINQGDKPTSGRKKRMRKANLEKLKTAESKELVKRDGAAFFAVCRGKVSEGIDFSDDYARVVIIVGIPFPNINDVQVNLKKKYNDTYKASKNLLSGDEWYCHQAFRALNQAAGRCIRHRLDYGAIILLDERYMKERNRMYISKWLLASIQLHDRFEVALEGLKSFFRDAKEAVTNAKGSLSVHFETDKSLSRDEQHQELRKAEKPYKISDFYERCSEVVGTTSQDPKISVYASPQITRENYGHVKPDTATIEFECVSPKDSVDTIQRSRYNEAASSQDPVLTLIDESSSISAEAVSRNINSSEVGTARSSRLPSLTSNGIYQHQTSIYVTPEKMLKRDTSRLNSEDELTFNLSISSCTHKRRSIISSANTDLYSSADASCCSAFPSSSIACKDINRKMRYGMELNYSESWDIVSKSQDLGSGPVSCTDHANGRSLHISCAYCKTSLGLPQNHHKVWGKLTSSSKLHLLSLANEALKHQAKKSISSTVRVIMTDVCSLNFQHGKDKGVWCEEDGCVFKSVYCPFCSNPCCLGSLIMATDSSNFQFLNKVFLFMDCLEIHNLERPACETPTKDFPSPAASVDKVAALNSIDRFAYSPQEVSGGWRTTKSKVTGNSLAFS